MFKSLQNTALIHWPLSVMHPVTSTGSPPLRKLLILDLNGTLLLRKKKPRNKPKLQSENNAISPQVRLHPVHPRPYLTSLREYLFHPNTRTWLDTMVWSSAQPPSVADMVDRCFSTNKVDLLAVWARDTLGLSESEYFNKTPTTKDLNKAWKAFPQHSRATTFLVDDSVHKARLHPWNHICVPEYTSKTRARDVEISMQEGGVIDEGEDSVSGGYDKILLAVIGVLDELKTESDVASWNCMRGLRNNARESRAQKTEDCTKHDEEQLWFESATAMAFWTDRGRTALRELGIEVRSGMQGR